MKKFGTLLFLFVFVMLGNVIANENGNSTESQGRTWKVIVTYNIYYSFYEDEYGSKPVAEGVYQKSESLILEEYADTADEAESKAKNECYQVCSNYNGKYVGRKLYSGKVYHAFETRKVASARAQ